MGINNFFRVAVPQGFFFTPEGGIGIRMINDTGGVSTKGYLVRPSATVNRAVRYAIIDVPDITGVFYKGGVADGEEEIVIVDGLAYVYYINAVQRDWHARNRVLAEGGVAGQAIGEAFPTAPFATDKHFGEVGHIKETIGGAGLALTNVHFN